MLAITAAVSGMALPAQAAQEVPENSAVSMILVHGESGTVLAEKNADSRCLIASTTKIMTALTALELAEPEDTVIIDPAWTAVEGSSMYLQAGETYTLRELLYGLLLASGNDGAVAVAHLAAGDEGAFVERMNEKARALGLTNTHFENPHGLDGQEHYSTARDLAVIMAAAMENETFREITAAQSATVHGQTYSNHNRLLGECAGGKRRKDWIHQSCRTVPGKYLQPGWAGADLRNALRSGRLAGPRGTVRLGLWRVPVRTVPGRDGAGPSAGGVWR